MKFECLGLALAQVSSHFVVDLVLNVSSCCSECYSCLMSCLEIVLELLAAYILSFPYNVYGGCSV